MGVRQETMVLKILFRPLHVQIVAQCNITLYDRVVLFVDTSRLSLIIMDDVYGNYLSVMDHSPK